MEAEITRWRIAYDTISALVAVDQRGTERPQAQQPVSSSPSTAAAAAAAAGGGGVSCAAGDVSSHRDNGEMIQRERQQQQRRDVAGARMTQSSVSAVFQSLQSNHTNTTPTVTSLPGPNYFRSAAPMRSLAAECGATVSDWQRDDAARLVHDSEALVGLFRRLLDTFYMETLLWMYSNVLLHPAARRTRSRLHWLGVVTGRGLEQATSNVLTGFVAGYRQSRQALNGDIEETLSTTGNGRAGRLAVLAVELGVILNPRQMIRSFSAVVRDLVFRTSFQTALTNTNPCPAAARLYRYLA